MWRCNQQNSTSLNETEKKSFSSSFIKDCYIDLIEYADCVFNENGDVEVQEVSGIIDVEAKLPCSSPKMTVKLRFNQDLEDFAVHSQCEGKGL